MKDGFIDIHTHGAINIDVNCASVEELLKLSDFYSEHGCSGWVPTVMTSSEENMAESCRRIAQAMRIQEHGARILGVYLEGPILSPLFAGAMPPFYLKKGDCGLVERLIKASDGSIIRLAIAPEVDGAYEVIREFSDQISISLGHSNATYDEAMKAFDLGAKCITHCGNAMRLFHQHEPGLLGAAFDSDCMIEVIADGLHLAPNTVKVFMNMKGPDHIVVITDSMSAAGMGDGEFILGGNKVLVRNGDATLPESGVRAGSVLTMDKAFLNVKRFTGLDDKTLYPMFRENQEKLLGL